MLVQQSEELPMLGQQSGDSDSNQQQGLTGNVRMGRNEIVGKHWVRTDSLNEIVSFLEFVEIVVLGLWRGVAEVDN